MSLPYDDFKPRGVPPFGIPSSAPQKPQDHTVDFLEFACQEIIPSYAAGNIHLSIEPHQFTRGLLVQLRAYIAAKVLEEAVLPDEELSNTETVVYNYCPDSLWDHFKQRCKELMPTLFARAVVCQRVIATMTHTRITVKRVTQVTRLCPHIEKPAGQSHLRWMEYGEQPPVQQQFAAPLRQGVAAEPFRSYQPKTTPAQPEEGLGR